MKLEINNISKKYGHHRALSALTLTIPDFQTLVLIGPSGSGKSTCLRLMAGLIIPDSGWIAFDGKKIIFEENALRTYRQSLGIVFQSWNLFPHLTALENIMLPLFRVHGIRRDEAEGRSLHLLKRFALDKHAHKKPYQLSGGQVQRVALIRAIACQPHMLMLDEPTSALDPLMSAEVLELIGELKNEQRHLILVTHHLNFARKIADHVLFFADGRVIEQGNGNKVFDRPGSHLAKQYMASAFSY